MAEKTYSGFVAIVGKPNVGKSTLLNNLLGVKVAPISPRPQTTRKRLRGILTEGSPWTPWGSSWTRRCTRPSPT